MQIKFTLNGEPVTTHFTSGDRLLVDVLREDLQLTGTKHGCGIGACGTCTVIVDGLPVASCLQLAALVDGADVRTVEGLAGAASLHVVQQAFINAAALQCGICTPGHVMAACALLAKTPTPTDDRDPHQRRKRLLPLHRLRPHRGRVSRSGRARAKSSAHEPARPKPASRRQLAGRRQEMCRAPTRFPRLPAPRNTSRTCTCRACSTRPCCAARIRTRALLSIDITAAAALPGVKAVVTGADTARKKWGCFRPDLYPLAIDKVRYVGDEVAAVAARDPQTARAAIDLIKVEYEVLPAVLSLDEALAPGAPRVHDDAEGNVAHQFAFERGDVDAGFKASDVIVEGTWQSARQWHTSLETIGCVAQWTGDRVSLWCNTQTPFLARGRYAIALGLPESKVRVVQTEVGGGFGGKSGDDNASVICALLAKKSGKPVKLIHTREEEFLASHPRMPMRYWVRLGFSRDGRIKAKEIKMLADNGAYTGKSQAILGAATVRHDALYKYPCARADSTLVYTNLVPTGAFRGFGNPSADWAVEQCWDLAAEKLGIDVVDLLRLNAVEPGDVSPHNHKITSCELKQCIDKSAHMIGWKEKRAKRTPDRGLGIGCSVHVNGRRSFGDWDGSSAIVRINDDGRATIITGEGEIGQGTLTVLRQIAAEELGLAVRRRRYHAPRH